MNNPPKHFFISFNSADRLWAEWIAWQLESKKYSIAFQLQDIWLDSNLPQEQKSTEVAECTIAVLSPSYLDVLSQTSANPLTFNGESSSGLGNVLPVQVRECREILGRLFELIDWIDLVGLDEKAASERLIENAHRKRMKPTTSPGFPGVFQRASNIQRPRFPGTLPPNLPYQRNPFFTGREPIFKHLIGNFQRDKMGPIPQAQAISGLSGIGKTQIAIEYAYRYYGQYKAIFWIKASSRDAMISDFVNIAEVFDLPERAELDQNYVINVVKHKLKEFSNWLLIFDDVEDLEIVHSLIPPIGRGHILLTTQAQALGRIAQCIRIDKMTPEEGTVLLLRRANIIAEDALIDEVSTVDRLQAQQIVEDMDGLPLALDQAGAYIEETECGLAGYRERYHTQRHALLKRRGGLTPIDHPEPVATTWLLSFQKILQANPASIHLLRLCAFLHADAIPEEIVTEGASKFDSNFRSITADPFKFDTAIEELRKYSLVQRNTNQTLTLHRLVQAVLKGEMSLRKQRLWAERAVYAVNSVFPEVEFAQWERCQRYLPQVHICADLIEQWSFYTPEAARLLNLAAFYLWQRAQYGPAEHLYQRSLEIREQILGPEHPNVATSLHNMGLLYRSLGKYDQSEALFKRALTIRSQIYGAEHPDVASSMHELAWLYRAQGKYDQAEPLFERALAIREKTLGEEHSDLATSLNELAWLYRTLGKYEHAQKRFFQALHMRQHLFGLQHPDVAQTLNDLAWLYYDWGQYKKAEELSLQARDIREQTLGSEHPHLAQTLNNLAWIYLIQGKYAQAEPLYRRVLNIREQVLGKEHPYVAITLDNLASLYFRQGMYTKAEEYYQRALEIREKVWGSEHPDTSQTFNNLGLLYYIQGKNEEAELLLKQSLAIRERVFGTEHPHVANCLDNLAELNRVKKKYDLAETQDQHALQIRERVFGPTHPRIAQTLNNLASLHSELGHLAEAEVYYRRALAIREQTLGLEHPHVAETLSKLASLYTQQGRYEEAEPIYKRAIKIREKTLAPNHPDIAVVLDNYAFLLRETGREAQALELETQAAGIRAKHAEENPVSIHANI